MSSHTSSNTDPATVRWGIIGTGAIAQAFARALEHTPNGRLVAVGSRSEQSAIRFRDEHARPDVRAHASYADLIADDAVDAVYVSTPHPLHAEPTLAAAAVGKHILCEKPIALNHDQAAAMIDAAREHGVFLMEAFMYRCHPQTARLIELIHEGAVGQVTQIHASFGFAAGYDPDSRLFNNALGGGGILDVGCYTISFNRLVAGAASGEPFLDPDDITGHGVIGETGVDLTAVASLRFPNGVLGQAATAVRTHLDNRARVCGTDGWIELDEPWTHDRHNGGCFTLKLYRGWATEPEHIDVNCDVTAFTCEAELAGRAILAGRHQPEPPAMTWADTLGNMRTLDRWRAAIGQVYDQEKTAPATGA